MLELLATDEKFLDLVFEYLVVSQSLVNSAHNAQELIFLWTQNQEEPNANLLAMLLANLTKWDGLKSVIDRRQKAPEALGSDDSVLNQLMDLFVKGQDGGYNKAADFDHLAYAFADLAKHAEVRQYLLRAQSYDGVVPLSKLLVFTEHASGVRRKGVASTIKNAAFEVPAHPDLLDGDGVNILPYVLLPIMGSEEYDVDETMDMLPDLQLLPPDKKRDDDPAIIQTHLETLMLLTTSREGRELMRRVKVYPIVRETHARVSDEAVKEACDRLVQVIMRDEEELDEANRVQEIEDDDDQIVEV